MSLQPTRTEEEIEAFRRSLAGRPVAVIGAGRSGMACLRRLAEAGAEVTLADAQSRDALAEAFAEAEALGADPVTGFERFDQIQGVSLIVSSPGVAWEHEALVAARARGVEVIGTLELAWRLCPAPVIGVTGTNGKGTTCRLIAAMLREAGIGHILAGNIGNPLADELAHATAEAPAVVEISSFQLEGIDQFRARVATVLNITPDHLDRHPSFQAYRAAKARLFENQRPDDIAVVNLDDEAARQVAHGSAGRKVTVSLQAPDAHATVRDGLIVLRIEGEEQVCRAEAFPLPGRHHLTNVLVASAIASLAGAPAVAIAEAIVRYRPPKHHMEVVGEIGGVTFINDSKASNPSAALADLSSMPQPFVAIVGGKDKGADLRELAELLRERPRGVVLIGEAADRIAALMAGGFERAESMGEAVRRAREMARPGDAVILAPACSSFDMFEDYERRGEVFRESVRSLQSE
ncbi:MAG: UDP-N-acetylmuramoyl-L-alanine--D-glutamate ligase [Armatimonadota bacterium]